MPTIKRTNEEWRLLLAEQRASGQSQEEWCTANGVNLYTLRDRVSRLKKLDREQGSASGQVKTGSVGWVEIKPERLTEKNTCIQVGCDGFVVTVGTGFNAELLTAVLRAVSRACC